MKNPNFSINKYGNHFLTFESPINSDNGYINTYQGEHVSTMELFLHDDPDTGELSTKTNGCGAIEWYVESLDMGANIGLWWRHGKLVDYDGVYELPPEAAKLLKKFGVSTPKDING